MLQTPEKSEQFIPFIWLFNFVETEVMTHSRDRKLKKGFTFPSFPIKCNVRINQVSIIWTVSNFA